MRVLTPGGSFYATFPQECRNASNFESELAQPRGRNGTTTYSDREPYHYSFAMLAALAGVVGGRAARVEDTSHPRGEAVMMITRA